MKILLEDYQRRLKNIRELINEFQQSEYTESPIRIHQKESCYREFIVEIERAIARQTQENE